jgi:hypothetical protein
MCLLGISDMSGDCFGSSRFNLKFICVRCNALSHHPINSSTTRRFLSRDEHAMGMPL